MGKVTNLLYLISAASISGTSCWLFSTPFQYLSRTTSATIEKWPGTKPPELMQIATTPVPQTDAVLLQQILTQETSLRLELERTVKEMKEDFENMKATLSQTKAEQDMLKQQFIDNITLLRVENEQLKQLINNSSSTSKPHACHCNLTNVTRELKNFNTDFRYISLSLLDLRKETKAMNDNMTTAIQNLETIHNKDRSHQSSINAGILAHHENVSNAIKDQIDAEILNLTTRYFDLENQEALLLSTVENLEFLRPKVESFMNETKDWQKILLRIQHEQIKMSTDIFKLTNNGTSAESWEQVAFTATVTQDMTSQNGQTLVFPHIITNVGGGYNGNSGVFTAPRDGVYVFFCRITASINPTDMYFEFILNGSTKTQNLVYGRNANPYRTSSNSIVLQLTHGDRVWIKMLTGGKHYSTSAGGDQSFSGYLL